MHALILLIGLAAAQVELHLAPDQPIPMVYSGEPLVIEFASPEQVTIAVKADIRHEFGDVIRADLGRFTLRPGGVYWHAIEDLAEACGRYTAHFQVEARGETTSHDASFVRIDRPLGLKPLDVSVKIGTADKADLIALANIPVGYAQLDASRPGFRRTVADLATAGIRTAALFYAAPGSDAAAGAEALARDIGNQVFLWEIDLGGEAPSLGDISGALRRGGSRAPVGLCVDGPDAASAFLARGAGRFADRLVCRGDLSPADIAAVREAVEQAGYENLPIILDANALPEEGQVGGAVVGHLIENRAAGAVHTVVDGTLLFSNEAFGDAYALVSGLTHRLQDARYVGRIGADSETRLHAFCAQDEWLAVAWTTGEPVDAALPAAGATDLVLTDALNNRLAAPVLEHGALTLHLTGTPVCLSGRGGAILEQAALGEMRREAHALLDEKRLLEQIPPELASFVHNLSGDDAAPPERRHFFALLRMFPEVEQEWHSGTIPRAVAAPVLACMARLSRDLCVLEQERGEPFHAPLNDTLQKSAEYRAAYLTGSGAASGARERGDWLMAEVSRLIAEAQRLDTSGRAIEAAAVAALAEWRARALEYAAEAKPLSEPEPPGAAIPEPEAENKE